MKKKGKSAKARGKQPQKMRDGAQRTMTLTTPIRPPVIPLGARSHRELGRELVWTGATTGTYAKLLGMVVAPSTIGPRVAKLGTLYEKYRFNSLSFEVMLQGPTTSSASVIQAFDADPGDPDPTQDLDGVKLMSSWKHTRTSTFLDGQKHLMPVRVNQPDAGYYTSFDPAGDYRLSYCGQYYLYAIAGDANVNALVYCTFDVTFYEPQLENPISAIFTTTVVTGQPALANAWSLGHTMANAAKVGGATVTIDSLGECLVLQPGAYILYQSYTPSIAPGTNTGFGQPAVVAIRGWYTFTALTTVYTSGAIGLSSTTITSITVAANSLLTLRGVFVSAAEGGYPTVNCILAKTH